MLTRIVIDTNVFVAAGFNRQSASARVLELVHSGQLRMMWNERTRRETKHILEKIPHLDWDAAAVLFQDEDFIQTARSDSEFSQIPDPEDRKFAALAEAAVAVLVTNDNDLLNQRGQLEIEVIKPAEFIEAWNRKSR